MRDFGSLAANPDRKGKVEVALELKEFAGRAASGPVERRPWRSGPHAKFPVRPSPVKVVNFSLTGKGVDPAKAAKLALPAWRESALVIRARFYPKEQVDNLHVFEVTQTTTQGELQGAVRLLALMTR